MNDWAINYIEGNIVCSIVFTILLLHNHFNIDRQEKQIKFDHALFVFILYFLADCFWAAISTEMIPKTRFTVVVNVFSIFVLMAATTYFWLDYVLAVEQLPHRNRPINRFVVFFPFLISTIALIIHYLVAPLMLVDEQLNTTSVYSIYLVAVPWIYLFAILFYTVRKTRKEENPIEKRKHLFVGLMPLMTMFGGIIQMLQPQMPIYCFICLILMLLFYIQSIEARISLDPLTNLNNRGQLTRYISQSSNLYLPDRMTFVIMMDINDFKFINDTYGHAEGDKALVIVSDSLKQVINRHNIPSFLGRYGGDEFVLIIHPEAQEKTERLISEIREEIIQHCKSSNTPYVISIGAGYAQLKDKQDSVQNCFLRADKKLYLDKNAIKNQKR